MNRRQKRILKEKVSEWIGGAGFLIFLIFGAAIDGPGNDMRVVYTGLAIAFTMMAVGATIGGWWDD